VPEGGGKKHAKQTGRKGKQARDLIHVV